VNKWIKKQGGSWKYLIKKGDRQKALARALLNHHVQRGLIKRLPCEACGKPETEGHHHKGYAPENALNVRWLCKKHHDEAERILKSLLTTQPLLL
jgi:hypothetical protein